MIFLKDKFGVAMINATKVTYDQLTKTLTIVTNLRVSLQVLLGLTFLDNSGL